MMADDTKKEEPKKIDVRDQVMAQIKEGQVQMRPRLLFVLISLLLGAGLAGAIVVGIFFVAITAFRLRVYGAFGFLRFGGVGLRPFLATFPWVPLVVALLGTATGMWLMRRYDFSYKRSFLGMMVGVVAFVLLVGLVVGEVGLREDDYEHRPPLESLLHQRQVAGEQWVVGVIQEFDGDELILIAPRGEEIVLRLELEEEDELPFGDFTVGQRIRAIGKWEDDVFHVESIANGHVLHGRDVRRIPGPPKGEHRELRYRP